MQYRDGARCAIMLMTAASLQLPLLVYNVGPCSSQYPRASILPTLLPILLLRARRLLIPKRKPTRSFIRACLATDATTTTRKEDAPPAHRGQSPRAHRRE